MWKTSETLRIVKKFRGYAGLLRVEAVPGHGLYAIISRIAPNAEGTLNFRDKVRVPRSINQISLSK